MDDVQMDFGRSVKEIHAEWGGHLTGFMIVCSKHLPTQPQGEVKQWFGGSPPVRMDLVVEAGHLALTALMNEMSCSPLEAMEVLSGKILERKFLRERQAREQRGKR